MLTQTSHAKLKLVFSFVAKTSINNEWRSKTLDMLLFLMICFNSFKHPYCKKKTEEDDAAKDGVSMYNTNILRVAELCGISD